MDRPVAVINFCLPVVIAKRSVRLGAAIVAAVAVRGDKTLVDKRIERVNGSIESAVAAHDESAVPVRREWQLNVISNAGRNESLGAAVGAAAGCRRELRA